MTSTASTHRRGGWLVLLLAAALTALVTMVLGLVNAGTASAVTTSSAGSSSASSSSAAGTRVGVSTSEPILVVGGSGSIDAGQGRGEALSQPYLVSGCCVAAEDSTTLYRAVDPNELADVRATGQFRAGGPSMSGKFFAENPEDAAQWGQTLNGGQGAVVGTRVPSSFADQLMRWEKLDGIGPARYVDESQLSEFNRLLSGIWEVS